MTDIEKVAASRMLSIRIVFEDGTVMDRSGEEVWPMLETLSAFRERMEADRGKGLRGAARRVLFDHAMSIVAAASEHLMDEEELEMSLEASRDLAVALGVNEDELPRPEGTL